ncbi:nuclear fragile X mental retardation protein interacting protein 1 [Homalodisca vitripennis]|uniref:Uncharacterized protein n=1 Tax=Homalodisca liturata TaxID=320908 RepID=A0A1B6HG66_9HEMI|nr:nuclear fragile X mental retardation protein interacting protein 1 [Homalodisca vitripennis]KAG8309699.1 nuclear fragile X mental retardation protein interacting protein 1 [Homalodisca vitripennis]KAG8319051.1 nuclear fragile X mental retardation protein interacting protein 1 [Homalodisca vitripennis]
MVRLFRGGRGGRGAPRPPFSYPLPPRPPRDFEPNFRLPFGAPRGRLLRGNLRPGPPHPRLPPPPRMAPSPLPPPPPRPLPLPPHQPLNHRDLRMPGPIPRRPHPMNRPGMPPPMHPHPLPPPGSPLRRPLRPGPPGPPPFMRGRGGLARRGVGLKRLGTNTPANGRNKKVSKRKEKKEESEVNKPWVTENLKTEIRKKYQLFEAAKEKKTDADWQAFKDQRILVGKMTNIAKLEYIGSHPEADVDQIMYGSTPGNKAQM